MPNPSSLRNHTRTIRNLLQAVELLTRTVRESLDDDGATQKFVPTQFQQDILNALDGVALRTDALTHKLDCANGQLFRKPVRGIPELIAHGLVAKHDRLGFYRPDSPPQEIEQKADQSLSSHELVSDQEETK